MKADRKKLKQIMGRAHVTVHDLAKTIELPPQTTAAIICGMNVQPDTLLKIAQALNVGLADIALGVVPVPCRGEDKSSLQGCAPPRLPAGQVEISMEKFALAMARSGLNGKQLAERAGVAPSTVHSIKRGVKAHRQETVDRLAEALGVSPSHLIKKEGRI